MARHCRRRLGVTKDGELVIETASLPEDPSWTLETCVRLDPASNTSLEGLYVSGGLFTTQCEAEGFRRITPFPDRPDVLSRYRVRIEADQTELPRAVEQRQLHSNWQSSRGASFRRMGRPLPQALLSLCLGGGPLAGGARSVHHCFRACGGFAHSCGAR